MSVQVRTLGDKDFFSWLGLFEGYSEFYKSELTDEKALQVWSWIIDKNHPLEGAVAVDGDGTFVGFTHFRIVPDTLRATNGLFLDDLFVSDETRGAGVGRALINHVRDYAATHKLSGIQLITAADNTTAQRLYDDMGTRTEWVTYEIAL
ncbi:GNAT family N-acetyltransferase [Glaciibacter psychrotolerans]|uniref:Ribosomal protein S18 acetylase RimI-like enzyme n=1 Tax=Glaciibacter psychrotolerans TaxID=670054 RepID=A0A7Z0EDE1_9MICO|nr:GNAT family N-acetyltransferase [Leifsonia psychrotolerans]NYJ18974.1 ribosomal protein S18 acetylase RimI-like enzyme [Leifsonia psychrotolerans]